MICLYILLPLVLYNTITLTYILWCLFISTQMHFYFGYHNVRVLVKGWEINSIGGTSIQALIHYTHVNVAVLLASVAAIYICAVLYEGLKTLRQVLYHNRFKMLNTAKTYLSVNYEKLTSVVEVKSEKTRYFV